MMRRHVLASALGLTLLCAAAPAMAQFNQYWLPVEQGFVDSHLDVNFAYSKIDLGEEGVSSSILSIEGQYAFRKRFEVGLNVPVLRHGFAGPYGVSDDSEFGDIVLGTKLGLLGKDTIGLAIFCNTLLPTHTGPGGNDFVILTPGVAASVHLLGLRLGAAAQAIWYARKGDDKALLGLDAYGGFSLLGLLSFRLALSYANTIAKAPGEEEIQAFALTPGAEVSLFDVLRIGVASRIALNDSAKALYMGRASLLLHGGISF